eukprot:NODE_644_length_5057_cov_0.295079.p4 type:complete len:132 gc:universal NODE_644_length_5057_cov_0.295079:1297-1692(+)
MWLWLFAVLLSALLLFCMVFFIILFSDLECDYINPIDLCNKLNQFVLPHAGFHILLTFFTMFLSGWLLIWNIPVLLYLGDKYRKQQLMFDATEIFRGLPVHKKQAFVLLGFYLLSFFIYLYGMIADLVGES